ncbi:MAG: hypothetical protein WAL38_25585, partial [Solirubrobacteraceae bacterium]
DTDRITTGLNTQPPEVFVAAGLADRGVDVSLMQPPVSSDVERYADTYTMGPSAAVSALPSQTQTVTPFPGMAGGVKELRLLEALMWAMGARRVLEVGTFTGAPAVALAEALPGHGAGSRSTPRPTVCAYSSSTALPPERATSVSPWDPGSCWAQAPSTAKRLDAAWATRPCLDSM